MTQNEKLLITDPSTAEYRTDIKGWVSKDGRFYGENEHLARWNSCTHIICDCGKECEKSYTICDDCRSKKDIEKYEKMAFKDMQYWDEKDIEDFINDGEATEDQHLSDLCPDLADLIEKINEYIMVEKPRFSWRPGKYRTYFKKERT